jgi:hypothetical protein
MKVAMFLFGALSGAAFVITILLGVEIVRVYREIDVDPWQEFASEEAPAKPFDWERWKTVDEINQERKAKNEFYNREEVEFDIEDENL